MQVLVSQWKEPLGGKLAPSDSRNGSRGGCLGLLPARGGCSWCDFRVVLLELGYSLSSDKEEKLLWELFPCCDWGTLDPVCWKGCCDGALECWSHPLVPWWHWDEWYSETEGAHLGGTQPGTRRKPWNAWVLDWKWQRGSGFLLPVLSLSHF